MRLVALTGGIGSGKSTVSTLLSERGALLIDADAIVRELQQPGQPVLNAMIERWGPSILNADQTLHRASMAEIVFSDPVERTALEAIVHPAVGAEMRRRMDKASSDDGVVILDIPLLAEGAAKNGGEVDLRGASAVIVVDCPVQEAVGRLIAHRGLSRADAERRVKAQVGRSERLVLADFVVDNGSSLDNLKDELDRCWIWLGGLKSTVWPPVKPGAA